jgi:hypothetical protein
MSLETATHEDVIKGAGGCVVISEALSMNGCYFHVMQSGESQASKKRIRQLLTRERDVTGLTVVPTCNDHDERRVADLRYEAGDIGAGELNRLLTAYEDPHAQSVRDYYAIKPGHGAPGLPPFTDIME